MCRSSYSYGDWQLHAGADWEVGVAWKQTWLKMFDDGFNAMNVSSSQRFVLSRSGWIGTQRLSHSVWSGDIGSDFGSLHNQLFAGQGIGLSGIAVWTTDTGEQRLQRTLYSLPALLYPHPSSHLSSLFLCLSWLYLFYQAVMVGAATLRILCLWR